ncbi:pectin methylesterase 1 [Perilla frutescens var. frutescens]|nr:pectin methylesterase 1 [Perilla frutescens var. frutescens]
MNSVNSFKGYGKVDELEDAAFKRKLRKRIIILSISLVLLIALVGVVAGTLAYKKSKKDSGEVSAAQAAAIKSICGVTRYKDSCIASLDSSNSTNPRKIFDFSLMVVMDSLQKIADFPSDYANRTDDKLVKEALTVCAAVLNDAVESLNDTISAARGGANGNLRVDDLRTWLSAAATSQETCFDALGEANATFAGEIELLMKNSTEFVSNSLAIATKIVPVIEGFKIPSHRRLLAAAESGFPAWVTAGDRRLLQESLPAPNVTVAADGSGDVRSVAEAVARIPTKSAARFVIHVKAGEYVEHVDMDKSYWNVMIYGDGKGATIISGGKNFVDGTPTFSTATFAIAGRGFIARDITFKNTAGAAKHQAVAFRSGSDQSVFYRCSFDAFQDTLYAHSNRQFYRECDVTGTIDFIFGNAAVVFQNCKIQPRQPLANQFVTITAQGKKDPNQNTGISIQRCEMIPLDNLTVQTYLGRPWKDYSTTVIMETSIGGFLNPKGWISWVSNVDPPTSIFYAEYQNTGSGAGTADRVMWAGYKPMLTLTEASKYNVDSFIQGPSWLPSTSITFDST